MMERETDIVRLKKHPWPEFLMANYRYFNNDEKHIIRTCEYYVLIFMLERTLLFKEGGTELELHKGEWYIQKPYLLQQGSKGSPAPVYFYIHFFAEEFTDDCCTQNYVNIARDSSICLQKKGRFDAQLLKPLFDQLDYCCRNRPYDILSEQSIFLSILRNITPQSHKEDSNELACQIIQYISQNYTKDIHCEILADRFHFSTEYINRRTKQYIGLSPGQYLQKIRISKAKELLSNTDHTLSYIATTVGYHDPTVFYKAFKKQTNMSPGNWRVRSRGLI